MNIKIRGMGMLVDFNPGIFTGVKLSAYIANDKKDYIGARKVINNTDEDELIASTQKN